MDCPECRSEVSGAARYCPACGELIDPELRVIGRLVHEKVAAQFEELVKSRFADRELIEQQLVEQVSARLLHWSKLLIGFTALPLALVVLVLSLLGWRSYSDFAATVGKARNSVDERVRAFERQAAGFDAELKEIHAKLATVRDSVAQAELLRPKVSDLETRLSTIEVELQIDRDVPAATRKALKDFQTYLVTLGLQPTASKLHVMKAPPDSLGGITLMADGSSRMDVSVDFLNQPDVCMSQYASHTLLSYRRVFHEASPAPSIITALADYFAASFTDDPLIGDSMPGGARSDLSRPVNFSDVNDGRAWASGFWRLRERFGQRIADRLLFDAWFTAPQDDPLTAVSFVALIINADKRNFGGRHAEAIVQLFPVHKVNTKSLWKVSP